MGRAGVGRRVHFLTGNTGLANRALDAGANLVVGTGRLPKALTRDTEWNTLAERAYNCIGSVPALE